MRHRALVRAVVIGVAVVGMTLAPVVRWPAAGARQAAHHASAHQPPTVHHAWVDAAG